MNLRGIDLNLLVILDVLLDEAHVSHAAQRLNLSQPAVSAALQRCRHLFGDELLLRGGTTMHRTARADALRAPLRSILDGLEKLIDLEGVALADVDRRVRITASDLPTSMIAGPLLDVLRRTAPRLSIAFHPWQGGAAALAALKAGDTDLAVSVLSDDAEGIERITLLDETYRVAMRRDHPAARGFDLDKWLAWPHVLVSGRGQTRSPTDAQLAGMNRSRRIGLVVPSFQLVPALLESSDMIALLPAHSLHWRAVPGLVSFVPPIPVKGFALHLAWHRRQSGEPGIDHVIQTIRDIFAGLGAGSGDG